MVECILHICMAMGRILAHGVQVQAREAWAEERTRLQEVLYRHNTGLCHMGSTVVDGEETRCLLGAWEDTYHALPGEHSIARAVKDMRAALKALNHTYLGPQPPACKPVATAFRKALCPIPGSHYLLFQEEDHQQLPADIYPYGMAMFSRDVVKSLNRLLKKGFNDHSSRGTRARDGCRV